MSAAPQLRWVASDGVHLIWVWAACLLSLGGGGFFAFRDELQGAAENSEAGLSALGAIVQELMAQPVATPATGYLYGSRPIVLWPLGHTVSMDGLGERRPWGRVRVLGAAGEELIATLGTHVDTRLKVVLENLVWLPRLFLPGYSIQSIKESWNCSSLRQWPHSNDLHWPFMPSYSWR